MKHLTEKSDALKLFHKLNEANYEKMKESSLENNELYLEDIQKMNSNERWELWLSFHPVKQVEDSNEQDALYDLAEKQFENNFWGWAEETFKSKSNNFEEAVIPNSTNSVCPKCGSNNFLEIDDEEDEDGTQHFHLTCQDCGYTERDEYNFNESEDSLDSEDIPTYKEAIKSYNKTDYGYHNNVTTVYGELLDGNWFVHIPENDVINIYDTAITNKFIDTLYNYDDIDAEDDVRDDEWYDNFQKEHNITDRYDKDKLDNLEVELNSRYYDMPAKLEEDSLENNSEIQLYMNTWGNYNEYGADVENINGGWMDIDQAKEFLEAHKDEEPFINDTENVPGDLDIDEYTNPWEAIEELEYIENSDDKDALIAIIESIGKFDEAKEVYEKGDYTFFPGAEDDDDLGRAYVDLVGGLEGVVNAENYIDEEAYKESWRDTAEQDVRKNNPDLDEDSDEFEDEVENWLNGVASEQLEMDKASGADLSEYFDYEAFGRDLDYSGYFFASTGAVQTN